MGVRDRERKICFVPDLFSWNRECVASKKITAWSFVRQNYSNVTMSESE